MLSELNNVRTNFLSKLKLLFSMSHRLEFAYILKFVYYLNIVIGKVSFFNLSFLMIYNEQIGHLIDLQIDYSMQIESKYSYFLIIINLSCAYNLLPVI